MTGQEWQAMAEEERRWSAQMERGRSLQGWAERHEDRDGPPEEWGLLVAAVAILMSGILGVIWAAGWLVPWLRRALVGP